MCDITRGDHPVSVWLLDMKNSLKTIQRATHVLVSLYLTTRSLCGLLDDEELIENDSESYSCVGQSVPDHPLSVWLLDMNSLKTIHRATHVLVSPVPDHPLSVWLLDMKNSLKTIHRATHVLVSLYLTTRSLCGYWT